MLDLHGFDHGEERAGSDCVAKADRNLGNSARDGGKDATVCSCSVGFGRGIGDIFPGPGAVARVEPEFGIVANGMVQVFGAEYV